MKRVIVIIILLALTSLANTYADDNYTVDSGSEKIFKFDIGKQTYYVVALDDPESIAFDKNGNIYVSVQYEGQIDTIDMNGDSFLASGLKQPSFITYLIPDPSTVLLLGISALLFIITPRKKYSGHYSFNHQF